LDENQTRNLKIKKKGLKNRRKEEIASDLTLDVAALLA